MKKRLIFAATVLFAIGAFLAFGVFEIQTAFVDKTVNEPSPVTTSTVPGSSVNTSNSTTSKAPGSNGEFHGIEHETSGNAYLITTGTGGVLRIENLNTSNGPDLFVYLSKSPGGTQDYELGNDFIDLGPLKGNIGSQNYVVPDDVSLSEYKSVVIWCKRFSVAFGAAPLETSS